MLTCGSIVSILSWHICEIWTIPSLPPPSSTNAPIGIILTTLPLITIPTSGLKVKSLIIFLAIAAPSWSLDVIVTTPLSWISISAPEASIIALICFPPGPITVPISSVGIVIVVMLGANGDKWSAGLVITFLISPKICSLPSLAWAKALLRVSFAIPLAFISIWRAVIPSSLPVTLKSISPRKSSIPWISVNTTGSLSGSVIIPIATPPIIHLTGTPAFIKAIEEPQVEPIDVEPLDSNTSEVTRIV